MDVLLEIPVELTRSITTDWSSVVELVALDTAYCNKVKREQWANVLRQAVQFQNYEVHAELFEAYQIWMFARKIQTKKLVLKANYNETLCGEYLKDLGGCIEELVFEGMDEEGELEPIAALVEMHCSHVVILTCSSCALDVALINLLNKPSLTQLRILKCNDFKREYNDFTSFEGSHHLQLHSMHLCCPNSNWFVALILKLVDPCSLQQLNIMLDDSVQEVITTFLPYFCSLRSLGFSGSVDLEDDFLLEMLQLCPNILHLDSSDCTSLTDKIAHEFSQAIKQLRTLNISGTELSDEFLEVLAAHCSHSLQALYAGRCDDIEDGIGVVLDNCHQVRTVECMNDRLHENEAFNHLTTLIVWDMEDEGPDWLSEHCAKLKHLRLVFHDTDADGYDFMQLTDEVLPQLQTLSVCCEEEDEEPESLQELREARPDVQVYYNTDVLAYDLMKLPL